MDIFHSVFSARLVFVLGIINLVSGIFVLLTCRCIPALRVTGKIMQNRFFSWIYKYHCFTWWVFWVSVIVHAVFALALYGNPF
jgi:hypothetical protein